MICKRGHQIDIAMHAPVIAVDFIVSIDICTVTQIMIILPTVRILADIGKRRHDFKGRTRRIQSLRPTVYECCFVLVGAERLPVFCDFVRIVIGLADHCEHSSRFYLRHNNRTAV